MKVIDEKILKCPKCHCGDMKTIEDKIICASCNVEYEVVNNKAVFMSLAQSDVVDLLDKLKFKLKKFNKLYNFLIYLISPVYDNRSLKKFINQHVRNKNVVALNLGSGSSNISENVINLDIFDYENVDIVCDISNIPIKDNSVDIIFNIAVLEHVTDPESIVKEIHRILKKGGIVYSMIPFMQGFHASPYDFNRKTSEGIKELYKNFEMIKIENFGGPTSGFLWVFQEWLSIVLSFGIKQLHYILYLLIMLMTFPLKFLDIVFIHHPMAENISSGFVYIGRK